MKVATCPQCNEECTELYPFVRNHKGPALRFRAVCDDCLDHSNQNCSQCKADCADKLDELIICDGCGTPGQTCMTCLGISELPDGQWVCSRTCADLVFGKGIKRPLEQEEEEEQIVIFDNESEGPESLPPMEDAIDLTSPPKKRATLDEQKARLLETLYAKYQSIKLAQARAREVEKLRSACLDDIKDALEKKLEELTAVGLSLLQSLAAGCPDLVTRGAEEQSQFVANTQLIIHKHAAILQEAGVVKKQIEQVAVPLARLRELEAMDLSAEQLESVLDRAMTEYEFICGQ